MDKRPPIEPKMKREVRREAFYGCVKCGCPIIEYHHIEPWHIVRKHEKHNLVALCPTCHAEAHSGVYFTRKILEDKNNPFNKKTRSVQRQIMLDSFEKVSVKLGGCTFKNTKIILQVFGRNLIYFNIDPKGQALLNAIFFDEKDRILATVTDNEWKAYIYDDLWDITYSSGKLKINLGVKNISLELKAQGEELYIRTNMYVCGQKIDAEENFLRINNNIELRGCTIEADGVGICIG